ncbi:unnamed protein product [Adineta steineri]|uniref:Uncharacterized protein n=1 Tax=Adineta steineri TaxID=433720 RepID=A0A814PTW0_9BILA|nr:unnamed protein product [Adineta steineri]CAF3776445.1 unnamed protein product [Adineta steineri]
MDNSSLSLSHPILNRFCLTISSEIGHQIETLCHEETSIKYVFHPTNYPNLNNLVIRKRNNLFGTYN